MSTSSDTMLTVGGKRFRCDCGCNVFHVRKVRMLARRFPLPVEVVTDYACNACGAAYR